MKNAIKKEYDSELQKSNKISLDDFEKIELEVIDENLLSDISGGGDTININFCKIVKQ